jgi:membrane protease YdiL (CAAX protease family)
MTNTTQHNNYPGMAQSWGIFGIAVLSMLMFSPVLIVLQNVLGKELSFLLYYLCSMAFPLVFAHLARKKKTGNGKYNLKLGSVKVMLLVSIGIIAIQNGIISPVVNQIPMPDSVKDMFLELANQKGIFPFIAVVIAAPVLEEWIFRGIILDGLLRRYSPLKSIIFSSLLFGLVHLNPWQFVGALLIGLFSGWVFYRTGKLFLSVLIHFVNNLFAYAGMYFSDTETMMDMTLTEYYGGTINLVLIITGAIAIAVGCIWLLKKEFSVTEPFIWQPLNEKESVVLVEEETSLNN